MIATIRARIRTGKEQYLLSYDPYQNNERGTRYTNKPGIAI